MERTRKEGGEGRGRANLEGDVSEDHNRLQLSWESNLQCHGLSKLQAEGGSGPLLDDETVC